MSHKPIINNMKLPHKLEYACRVLAQLGRRYGQYSLVHIDDLAKAESIPANYLVQILKELRCAGLIISKRGKQGGYALSREPEKITLTEIVEAVDSELLDQNFDDQGQSGARVASIWAEIGKCFEIKMKEYTVSELVVKDTDAEMYYI